MKRLFESADEYTRQSDWKDFALVKMCLAAIGVMIGLHTPKKHKQTAGLLAQLVFVITYIPLMAKFLSILLGSPSEKTE